MSRKRKGESSHARRRRALLARRAWRIGFAVWALAILGSIAAQWGWSKRAEKDVPGATRETARLLVGDRAGKLREEKVSWLWWEPREVDASKAPVVLIHGSPGEADDMAAFGGMLRGAGYEVYSVDMPGFGGSQRWVSDYSIKANGHVLIALLDHLKIRRAHLIGWSLGGGAALHAAADEPSRVASVTMLASIGTMEAEGSGSYGFERAKYALGFFAAVIVPEFVPHFGLLGDRAHRFAFIRSFWDTDLRPMRALLQRITTPTLIVHGRDDPLVPAWGAELHHSLIPTSRLVMLDANHFLPLDIDPPGKKMDGHAAQTLTHVLPFLARHDRPGVPALPGVADFAPVTDTGRSDLGPFEVSRGTAWWLIVLLIIIATFITEDGTVIAVGLAIAHHQIDWGVGFIACLIGIAAGDGGLWLLGRVFGRRALRLPLLRGWLPESSLERWGRWFDRHTVQAVFLARVIPGTRLPTYLAAGLLSRRAHGFLFWAAVAAFVWTPFILITVIMVGPGVFEAVRSVFSGPVAIVVSIAVLFVGIRSVVYLFTWEGRRRLSRDVSLPWRHEFWPAWIFYAPLVPYALWLAAKHGKPMTFTCINPAIAHGGGTVGESKWEILEKLSASREWVIPTAYIPDHLAPADRASRVDEIVRNESRFGGYPVALKPDAAQRGHGFKVARSKEEAERYFRDMTRPAILQAFHPGPHEVGVLWSRDTNGGRGMIFSITKKRFQTLVGNGKDTLERLIWQHPRYRMQAETFLKRFDAQRDRVLGEGERLHLAVAGNHCQGTMFEDGAELITAELEARFNEISLSFAGDGLDFGRYDVRYEDEAEFRRGEGFQIIELNGTMSESTNMYDPKRSVWWAYGVLFRQWRAMFELGAWRRKQGVRPMRLVELLQAARDHFRGRPGSSVAD
ncbi:MAG: alpha/beta fold hydrolase [Phycisphaerales bacterium]